MSPNPRLFNKSIWEWSRSQKIFNAI
ncbi:hypothetical protein LCGC14_1022440, partial [marine sediment metagenome]